MYKSYIRKKQNYLLLCNFNGNASWYITGLVTKNLEPKYVVLNS